MSAVLFSSVGAAMAASPRLPDELVGTWTGKVDQPSSALRTYDTIMVLRPGETGGAVGTVDYPQLDCGGTLTLIDVGSSIRLREKITYGLARCIAEGEIELTVRADGSLAWKYYPSSDLTRLLATATLNRSPTVDGVPSSFTEEGFYALLRQLCQLRASVAVQQLLSPIPVPSVEEYPSVPVCVEALVDRIESLLPVAVVLNRCLLDIRRCPPAVLPEPEQT